MLVSQHAGKDLSTILNVTTDDPEADVDEDEGQEAGTDEGECQENDVDEEQSPKKKKKQRGHLRFTVEETNVLQNLLKAQGRVPKSGFLKNWLTRQGTMFAGRSIAMVRSKLYYLQRICKG